ncbi:uncharacterized protein LOC129274580 [Lytechinus pictus]|uniref:uncharacterized protein LOC129274580 n=1 Tax=Lytechinus pictus TaxID=7653 RepID=UPI00240D2BC0|nr:uncharacterized protein LOC129274580 [Lytechinus pictus]
MSTKALIVFAALLAVALAFDFDDAEDDLAADVEFMKRDPFTQDLLLAEKRGRNMKKYKACANAPGCWCTRRKNRVVFCAGAGDGGAI